MARDIYLISDTHFRHGNIYSFLGLDGKTRIREKFKDSFEGDAFMVEQWNATVKPQDICWHLGDFCMGHPNNWAEIGPRLQGHKRIVPGNHDQVGLDLYKKAGFQKMQGAKEIHVAGMRLLATHYPVHDSGLFSRDGNIHGHIHEKQVMRAGYEPDYRYFNVSVERINYTPVHIEEVAKLIKEKKNA